MNSNKKKYKRQNGAQPLPDGITQDDLPTYVNYVKEKNGREYFRIENHPTQIQELVWYNDRIQKRCTSSKAMSISIHEKLNQAINKIDELDKLYNSIHIDNEEHMIKLSFIAGRNDYEVWENKHKNKLVKMYTNNAHSFWFDYCDLEKVLEQQTWYINNKGSTNNGRDKLYISCNDGNTTLGLHQLIKNHRGNGYGPGQKNVDHIDKNTFNNRRGNLRIVSQSVQNKNVGKKSRRKDAKIPLPNGITQDMVPIHAYWSKNKYPTVNGETKFRYSFRIENHPAQQKGLITHKGKVQKRWQCTTSGKVNPLEKLNITKNKIQEMDLLFEEYNEELN